MLSPELKEVKILDCFAPLKVTLNSNDLKTSFNKYQFIETLIGFLK